MAKTDSISTSTGSSVIWWGATAVSLVVGFADLWRGGDVVGPILLVLGYCVFAPIAILKK